MRSVWHTHSVHVPHSWTRYDSPRTTLCLHPRQYLWRRAQCEWKSDIPTIQSGVTVYLISFPLSIGPFPFGRVRHTGQKSTQSKVDTSLWRSFAVTGQTERWSPAAATMTLAGDLERPRNKGMAPPPFPECRASEKCAGSLPDSRPPPKTRLPPLCAGGFHKGRNQPELPTIPPLLPPGRKDRNQQDRPRTSYTRISWTPGTLQTLPSVY
jgi:hypothetical protein